MVSKKAEPTDWVKHCKSFLKNCDTGGAAEQKAYTGRRGLSWNTFRVHLSKYKKSETYKRSLAQTQSAARLVKSKTSKKTGTSAQSPSENRAKNAGETIPVGAHVAKRVPKTKKHVVQKEDGLYKFAKGHSASLVHGKYSKILFLSPEYEELAQMSLRDQKSLLGQQYALIGVTAVSTENQLMDRYKNNDPITKKVMDSTGKVTDVELTFNEAMAEIAIASAMPMNEILKTMTTTESKLAAIEQAEYQQAAYTPAEIVFHTAEIMAYRDEESLSAKDTCNRFMLMGLVPPSTLVREFEKELNNTKPQPPADAGITGAEVRAIKTSQDIKRAKAATELNERRIANEKMYAGFTGVGDENVTTREPVTIDGESENA